MDTFVHRLMDQPTCGAILTGQTRRDAVPDPFFRTGDLLAETRNSCREFVQRGVYVAMVVPESARPQVVEHWLQRGPIFRADAVESDGVADVDIAKMAKVLSDRPDLPTLCPARLRRMAETTPDCAGSLR